MREVLLHLVQLRRTLDPLPPGPLPDEAPDVAALNEQIRLLTDRRQALLEQGGGGGRGGGVGAETQGHTRFPRHHRVETAECCLCWDDIPLTQGLQCRAQVGFGHFTCQNCLQAHATTQMDGAQLLVHRGAIRCPFSDVDTRGVPKHCDSPAWELTHLKPYLRPDTQVREDQRHTL